MRSSEQSCAFIVLVVVAVFVVGAISKHQHSDDRVEHRHVKLRIEKPEQPEPSPEIEERRAGFAEVGDVFAGVWTPRPNDLNGGTRQSWIFGGCPSADVFALIIKKTRKKYTGPSTESTITLYISREPGTEFKAGKRTLVVKSVTLKILRYAEKR